MSSNPGFDTPRPTKDPEIRALYERWCLPDAPTLAQIEPIAVALFGMEGTRLTGAELTVGRKLSKSDPVFTDINVDELGARELFGALLMQEAIRQNAEADIKDQVMLRIYDWITKNKKDIEPYFTKMSYMFKERGDDYFVILTWRDGGYKYLSLKVNLDQDSVELV